MKNLPPPLQDLLVLDFSTLLPGPMASLFLVEAGARVIKIERPDRGDEMRAYTPRAGTDSINFHLLNRGKQSIAIDLKAPDAVTRLRPLLEQVDVLIEQFRPGVMDKFGLGYAAMQQINPRLIYCSITAWGQSGPKSQMAAHDLNCMAETGVLALAAGIDGAPTVPPILAADVAGGALPAMINILLALRRRDMTGLGSYLDIAMADGLFTFAYWGIGNGVGADEWPKPGKELVTGGSPRYQIYRAADGRYVAAAPLEDKFWDNFCRIVDVPKHFRAADAPQHAVIAAVAARIYLKTSEQWRAAFDGQDVCCSIVADLKQAMQDPQVMARHLFDRRLLADNTVLPALPVPVVSEFRTAALCQSAPHLGEHTELLSRNNVV